MRNLSEWQKFEMTGKIADYLAYVGAEAKEHTVDMEGKEGDFVHAGYHYGDRNDSESGTCRGI
ncbi:MAG: hypothetical protein LUC90_00350 [Lachnospiraceae bacterium]|nr:hypothetical protein [Lachnospiraceae bacterium]